MPRVWGDSLVHRLTGSRLKSPRVAPSMLPPEGLGAGGTGGSVFLFTPKGDIPAEPVAPFSCSP